MLLVYLFADVIPVDFQFDFVSTFTLIYYFFFYNKSQYLNRCKQFSKVYSNIIGIQNVTASIDVHVR